MDNAKPHLEALGRASAEREAVERMRTDAVARRLAAIEEARAAGAQWFELARADAQGAGRPANTKALLRERDLLRKELKRARARGDHRNLVPMFRPASSSAVTGDATPYESSPTPTAKEDQVNTLIKRTIIEEFGKPGEEQAAADAPVAGTREAPVAPPAKDNDDAHAARMERAERRAAEVEAAEKQAAKPTKAEEQSDLGGVDGDLQVRCTPVRNRKR